MATLTFTYDTGNVTLAEITNAICAEYEYEAEIPAPPPAPKGTMIPNPETKAQFARRQVRQFIVGIVKAQRVKAAETTARSGVANPNFND